MPHSLTLDNLFCRWVLAVGNASNWMLRRESGDEGGASTGVSSVRQRFVIQLTSWGMPEEGGLTLGEWPSVC